MKDIPEPAKKRLVLLKRLLAGYGDELITSARIEEMTGWSAALVRRDISLLELKCGARGGYKVRELNEVLNSALNLGTEEIRCCIVGLGRLGERVQDMVLRTQPPLQHIFSEHLQCLTLLQFPGREW